MLNIMLDNRRLGNAVSEQTLMWNVLQKRNADFSSWWNSNGKSDGFSETTEGILRPPSESSRLRQESRSVVEPQGAANQEYSGAARGNRRDSIDMGNYKVGAKLFEECVSAC